MKNQTQNDGEDDACPLPEMMEIFFVVSSKGNT